MEETVGPFPDITPEEARNIFQSTGLDITGYRECLQRCAKECFDSDTVKYLGYIKDLQEFNTLCLPDKIILSKGMMLQHEIVFFPLLHFVDCYKNTCMFPWSP